MAEVEAESGVLTENFQQLVTKLPENTNSVVVEVALQARAQGMGNPGRTVVSPLAAVQGMAKVVYHTVVLLLEYHISGQIEEVAQKAVDSVVAYQFSPSLAVQTLGEVVMHA